MGNKKLYNAILATTLSLTLIGCSGGGQNNAKNNTSENIETKNEVVTENKNTSTNSKNTNSGVGYVDESEFGRVEVIKQKKNINDSFESGPIKCTVQDVQISKINPKGDSKQLFDNKDEVTAITLAVEVENTSDETISFYPDQGTIVTNTKEQKDADMLLSDSVGGDFIGQVVKKGNIIFILDSNASEINNVKFVLGSASNQNLENVGDEITISYDI